MVLAYQFCPTPLDGNNTLPADPNKLFQVGENYTYVCKDNFVPTSGTVSTCLPNNEWSLRPPTCAGKKIYY